MLIEDDPGRHLSSQSPSHLGCVMMEKKVKLLPQVPQGIKDELLLTLNGCGVGGQTLSSPSPPPLMSYPHTARLPAGLTGPQLDVFIELYL